MDRYITYLKKYCRNKPSFTLQEASNLYVSRMVAYEYGLTETDLRSINWAVIWVHITIKYTGSRQTNV